MGALHITYLVGAAFAVIAVFTSLVKGSTKGQRVSPNKADGAYAEEIIQAETVEKRPSTR